MHMPITQSKAWQKLQQDLGKTSFYEETPDFRYLAILETTPVGNYLYLPYGPVYEGRANFKRALASLQSLAKEHSAMFIRIEPEDPNFASYAPQNAKASKNLSPADTWRLDLTPDKATLLTHFTQGTRTRYNTFAKKGLSVSVSHDPADIKHLVALQQVLAARKNIHAYPEKYLEAELKQPFASLYLVHYTEPAATAQAAPPTTPQPELVSNPEPATSQPATSQIIAASLFFDYDGVRYYMQSAADDRYRKLPGTVALLSTALFDAKAAGLDTFDFWGIAPDDAPKSHPWAGFTAFKKSFGGYPVHYAGTYDLILHSAQYRLYHALRKLNRLRRHL